MIATRLKLRWPLVPLGTLAEFRNGVNFSKVNFGRGIKVIGVGDFQNNVKATFDNLEQINPEGVVRREHLLKNGDILFVRSNGNRDLIGRSMFVDGLHEEITHSAFSIRLRFVSEACDPRFYAYLFRSHLIRQALSLHGGGTNISNLNQDILGRLQVPLPPKFVQCKIGSILAAYDDLIENNTRRIKILEEMAKTIYREWFVHFRFPSHEKVEWEESQFGRTPRGWVSPYPDQVDFLEGPGLRRWQYRDSGLRFLNIRTINDGDIDLTKTQFIDPQEAEGKYQHFLLSQYDHVVSSSGTIGRVVTVRSDHLPLMLNTSVIRMRPRSDRIGKWQLKHFLQSDYFQAQIHSLASGVAQANFGPFHLKQMKVIAPPAELGTAYETIVDPIEELILNLRRKLRILRQTRDLLLPRLISGEVNVERFEAEAVAQGV